ncbi:MAG: dihydropteroate synthase [Chlorobiaceae bacterium]|nr:dihydropteroate synthase [Chlorobiaceae bacterium]
MSPTERTPAGFRLDCAGRILDLSGQPAVMGVVNLTPDSFFDGGRFIGTAPSPDLGKALESALDMVSAGADIIDVGGESTRPGAVAVSAEEEIERTARFIALLRSRSDVFVSIDTWKAAVAGEALRAGADIVNDISGFTFDPGMAALCGRHRCGVVLMHTPVRPGEMQWSHDTGTAGHDIVATVLEALARSIGIARSHGVESIVTDPGIGFGKSVEENFRLLARLDELHALGLPILAGVSRKSFLGQAIRRDGEGIPPPPERLDATTSANTIALLNGADILRVHDVGAAIQARAVVEALRRSCGGTE